MKNLINSSLKDLKESKVVNEEKKPIKESNLDVTFDFIKFLAGIYEREENDQSAVDSIANYIIKHDLADDVSSESYIQSLESEMNTSGDGFKSVLAEWVMSLLMTNN